VRNAFDLHDVLEQLLFIVAREERLSREKLRYDAA
jgi:hypothetical protein